MLDRWATRSVHPRSLMTRPWVLVLAWMASCSVYTDALLPAAGGGSAGRAGSGGAIAGSGEGGSGSPQAGTETGGSAAGAPEPPGGAATSGTGGTTTPGGEAGASAGGDDGEGGGGGEGPVDNCPDDPGKVEPGACGCGVPEVCAELRDALLHRYSFDGGGTVAVDSVGDANGAIVGATAKDGKVTFDGTTVSYVDLPNGLISSLTDASFEVWLTWAGGSNWQRIFDFGNNDKAEGQQGTGKTYLYLTPKEGSGNNALRAAFTRNGINSETSVRASAPLETGKSQHIALVVDDTNNQLRLYLNGELSALTGFQGKLSEISDVNNWLGRSNYMDPPLGGTIAEFRIYGAALTNAQVLASSSFGPDPKFLASAALQR